MKTNALNNFRVCDLSIVPLNQLQTLSEQGYCLVMIKQGKDSLCPELTLRERECLKYFLDDLPAKAIANDMKIEADVVRSMLSVIRQKFRVNTNNGLVSKVYQMGIDAML
jgi:DNA-binding CsgD family transcriptional regulator